MLLPLRTLTLATCCLLGAVMLPGCGESVDPQRQAAIYLESGKAYQEQGQYRAAMIEARNAIKFAPQSLDAYWLLADVMSQLGNPRASNEVLLSLKDVRDPRHLKRIAHNYVELGKIRSARELLADPALAGLAANDVALQVLQARIRAAEGQIDEALTALQRLTRTHPDARSVHLAMATLELQAGKAEAAADTISRWLKTHPADAEFLSLQATLALRDNRLDAGERLLTQALQALPQTDLLTPVKARVLRQLSAVLTQLGRSSEALAYSQLLAREAPGADEQRQKLNQALDLYRAGDLAKAEALLAGLYETSPGNRINALLLGLVQFEQGNYEQASELLADNVDPEVMSAPIIEAAALAQLREQRPEDALALLREALIDHGENARLQAIYGMAALQFEEHQDDGAIALNKALSLDPDRVQLRLPLADYYARSGRMDQARAQLLSAANQAPADAKIQTAALTFFLRTNEADTARSLMEQFLKAAPQQASTLVLAARLRMLDNDAAGARTLLDRALKAEPGNVDALLSLGQLAAQQRDWVAAAEHFRNAIKQAPDAVSAYKGLVSTYEAQGAASRGLVELSTLASTNGSAVPTAVLAEYHLRNGRVDEALTTVQGALNAVGTNAYVNLTAVRIFRAQAEAQRQANRLDAARSALMNAIQLQPENPELLGDLVRLELMAGKTEEAQRLIEQIRSQPGGHMHAALLSATMALAQGQPDKAAAILNARWQAAREPAVAERLYAVLRGQGRNQEAVELAAAWADRSPQDARPLTLLAMDAQGRGEGLLAARWYERSLALRPDQPVALNNLAWLKFEAGEEEALTLAQRASELAPDNPSVLDTYGWILFKRGDAKAALPILERAATLAPESQEISAHLSEVRRATSG